MGSNGVTPSSPPMPRRLFLFSHPRTVSNLFVKVLSEHPDVHQHTYPFLYPHFGGPDSQIPRNPDIKPNDAEKALMEMMKDATYQSVLDKLQREIAEDEAEGKIPFLKEHACYMTKAAIVKENLQNPRKMPPKPKMEDRLLDLPEEKRSQYKDQPYHTSDSPLPNPTILPDRLLRTISPMFIVRHPAKQVGSFYKANSKTRGLGRYDDDPEFEIPTCYKFVRLLFDYFRSIYLDEMATEQTAGTRLPWPILVDGDELINDTEGVTQRICKVTGLDHEGVIYKWKTVYNPDPLMGVFMGTLNASSGVVKNESPEIPSIDKEAVAWEKEWGHEVACFLKQRAESMMEDYLYLHQFRI